jgi:phosphohistidine phosphatase
MTTRQLFVLRHAKSSWEDPGLDDHDRPLAPRGRGATRVISDHMRANAMEPEVVLCSSARRTRETLEGVDPTGERLIEPELYGADASELIDRLRRVPDHVRSAMVIGHNPAMQMLVIRLTAGTQRSAPNPDLAEVQRKFPTGALATVTFDGDWSQLGPGRARLDAFVRPKQMSSLK